MYACRVCSRWYIPGLKITEQTPTKVALYPIVSYIVVVSFLDLFVPVAKSAPSTDHTSSIIPI